MTRAHCLRHKQPSSSPRRPMSSTRMHFARVAAAVLSVAVLTAPHAARAQSVWEFTPYRIQIYVAIGVAPELTAEAREDLIADLAARTNAIIGASWDLTITPAPPALHSALLADLEGVPNELLPKDALAHDKVILAAVVPERSGYRLAARELDVRTMTWNAAVEESVWQAFKLRDAMFGVVCDAFAPLAQIGAVDKKQVTLRLRAAALPIRDGSLGLVDSGDVFQPLFRYNDRDGNARRITTVPFTFLEVDKVAPMELQCTLHSGVRSPLGGRRRGRVEQLALAVVPPNRPTTLVLQSRSDAKHVLAGYDLYLSSEGSGFATWLGRTNWEGKLEVWPTRDPLRVLLVRSGGETLARLPIVPGLQSELIAPVPDNVEKLRAEGYVKGFQEDLIDLVTRREVLLAQARSHVQANRIDEAKALMKEIQAIATRDQLSRMLEQEAKKLVATDPGMQRKIDMLFADTEKILQQYLDPTAVEKLGDSLRERRVEKPSPKK